MYRWIWQSNCVSNLRLFILSLPRFLDIFGSIKAIAEKLVWLPTWHHSRLLCQQLSVPDSTVANIW